MNEKGWAVLAAVDDVANRLGATPAQVALAWIVSRPGMTGPIASATTPAQLQEIVGGISLTLDADAIAMLDTASA
jgi:aryl-alcohol dehydrogenase-like predicted oxidoreductase